jgi:hypothetical protein
VGDGDIELYVGTVISSLFVFSIMQDLRKKGFNPLSFRERVRVRGLKKAFFLIDPLIPTLSRREKEQNA